MDCNLVRIEDLQAYYEDLSWVSLTPLSGSKRKVFSLQEEVTTVDPEFSAREREIERRQSIAKRTMDQIVALGRYPKTHGIGCEGEEPTFILTTNGVPACELCAKARTQRHYKEDPRIWSKK